VKHRATQFRRELEDRLESMRLSQETVLTHIPKQVRSLTMREFGEKYNGDIQAALRGLHKAKFLNERGKEVLEKIDKDTRKRKWEASQDNGDTDHEKENSRAPKTAKLANPSPQRAGKAFGTPTKSRTLSRIPASPFTAGSPSKSRLAFTTSTSQYTKSRPVSPSKLGPNKTMSTFHSGVFNPSLPAKGPAYPLASNTRSALVAAGHVPASPKPKSLAAAVAVKQHNRTESQASNTSNGTTDLPASTASEYSSVPSSPTTRQQLQPLSQNTQNTGATPHNLFTPKNANGQKVDLARSLSFTMAISALNAGQGGTEGGTVGKQLISFDPFQTSPNSALAQLEKEGVTESARKEVKRQMSTFIREMADKWKIVE
jgi:hypothetical protein